MMMTSAIHTSGTEYPSLVRAEQLIAERLEQVSGRPGLRLLSEASAAGPAGAPALPGAATRARLVLLGYAAAGGEAVCRGESAIGAVEAFAAGTELVGMVSAAAATPSVLRRSSMLLRGSPEPATDRETTRAWTALQLHGIRLMHQASLELPTGAAAFQQVLESVSPGGATLPIEAHWLEPSELETDASARQLILEHRVLRDFVAPLLAGMRLAGETLPEAAAHWATRLGLAWHGIEEMRMLILPPQDLAVDGLRLLLDGHLALPMAVLRRRCRLPERRTLEAFSRAPLHPAERGQVWRLLDEHEVIPVGLEIIDREIDAAAEIDLPRHVDAAARQEMRGWESACRLALAHLRAVAQAMSLEGEE